MALRRRLSSGLPLSDVVLCVYYITNWGSFTLQELFKLLDLGFAGGKRICTGAADANIAGSIAHKLIISTATHNTILPAAPPDSFSGGGSEQEFVCPASITISTGTNHNSG